MKSLPYNLYNLVLFGGYRILKILWTTILFGRFQILCVAIVFQYKDTAVFFSFLWNFSQKFPNAFPIFSSSYVCICMCDILVYYLRVCVVAETHPSVRYRSFRRGIKRSMSSSIDIQFRLRIRLLTWRIKGREGSGGKLSEKRRARCAEKQFAALQKLYVDGAHEFFIAPQTPLRSMNAGNIAKIEFLNVTLHFAVGLWAIFGFAKVSFCWICAKVLKHVEKFQFVYFESFWISYNNYYSVKVFI